jgi:SAM-dependent methyltransferase
MNSIALDDLLDNPLDVKRLGGALRATGFSLPSVSREIGMTGAPSRLLTHTAFCSLSFYKENCSSRSVVGMLGTLFNLGGWIKRSEFESKTPVALKDLLYTYDLVEVMDSDLLRSTVSLYEINGLFFLSDRMLDRCKDSIKLTQNDSFHVDPPNYSSVSLFNQVRSNTSSVKGSLLDVGCGTGCQALLSRPFFREVYGIDINSRCVSYSKLNAILNNLDIAFEERDCLEMPGSRKFDSIFFNVPSVPRYRDELTKVDTYTSTLGYSLALDFCNNKLTELMQERGECLLWSIFAVNRESASILNILKSQFSFDNEFDLHVSIEKDSPFGLSEDSIAKGKIPWDSYLLAKSEDRDVYLEFLKKNEIKFIAPALIRIRGKAGQAPRFEERYVQRFA